MRRTFLAVGLLLWAASAAAQSSIVVRVPKEVVNVGLGTELVLQTTQPFSSVTVADPEVADVLPRSDRVLVVVGKKPGISDVALFAESTLLHHVTVNVTAAPIAGKILTHNKRELSTYTSYQCNPVCSRIDDKHENRPPQIVVLTPAGPVATSSTNVIVSPPPH